MSELFPDDIITEILLRVPVKSILRFKYVSKTWRAIIESDVFVKQHLKSSSLTKTNHKIIFHDLYDGNLHSIGLYSLERTPELAPPLNPNYHDVTELVGSCNGLLCLYSKYSGGMILIWNPTTRKHVKLPQPPVQNRMGVRTVYGFGYDSTADDYKVVIQVEKKRLDNAFAFESYIYSLRSNSWKKSMATVVKGFRIRYIKFSATKVRGVLYWIVTEQSVGLNTFPYFIVAFDLKTEEHKLITLPETCVGKSFSLSLSKLGGCLSIACDFSGGFVEVWAMKDYGVRESWTKLLTVVYEGVPNLTPSVYSECGDEVLMSFSGNCNRLVIRVSSCRLLSCNLENRTAKFVDVGFPPLFRHVIYLESLVSLGGKSENG